MITIKIDEVTNNNQEMIAVLESIIRQIRNGVKERPYWKLIGEEENKFEKFDSVDMPEPTEPGDAWQHSFTGQFLKYDRGYAVIIDSEGDHFDIEPYRLVKSEDN